MLWYSNKPASLVYHMSGYFLQYSSMRYVAAYCLFALSGKTPTAKDLEKMLGSVGVDCDAEQAKKVVSELDGKNLDELIREGEHSTLMCFRFVGKAQIFMFHA